MRGGERSLSAPLRVPSRGAPSLRRQSRGWSGTPVSSENKAGHGLPARLQLRGQSVHRNTSDLGGLVLWGPVCPVGWGSDPPCGRPAPGKEAAPFGRGAAGERGGRSRQPCSEGLGVRTTDHKGPVTPTELPSVMAQEHSWLVLRSRGLTRRRGAPPGSGLSLQQGADQEERGPTWLTQLAWLRVLTARM